MQQAPRPRRDGDDFALTDPRFADANYLNADERLVGETDYPTPPHARVGNLNGSIEVAPGERPSGVVARAADLLLSWVQRDPAAALGTALALGLAVGFVLRRSVLLSAWEMEEVKRV